MVKLFDYIYYRLHTFYIKYGNRTGSNSMATGGLSAIQTLTIVNIIYLGRVIWSYNLPESWTVIPVMIIFMIVNWFIYEREPKFQELDKIWSKQDHGTKKINDIMIGAYLIISLLIPIMEAIVYRN